MYFNRKNSQQKNWRMIKKGKHFLFGCALVFALGATANVAKADTVLKDSATAVDNALPSSDSQGEADSEEDSSSQAAPAAIAYRAYEVRYIDENGQVIHKTANVETTGANGIIVQADAIPEGYELAQGQTEYVTHTFTAEEVNVVTIQIVKKAEVVHAADKTVLEQVTSEADLLADEALRQVAKEQASNTALETAAQATKAAAQEAQVVLADTRAVQEVVDAQVELVKASTKALHDEMLKVDADGTVTTQLKVEAAANAGGSGHNGFYVTGRNSDTGSIDSEPRVKISIAKVEGQNVTFDIVLKNEIPNKNNKTHVFGLGTDVDANSLQIKRFGSSSASGPWAQEGSWTYANWPGRKASGQTGGLLYHYNNLRSQDSSTTSQQATLNPSTIGVVLDHDNPSGSTYVKYSVTARVRDGKMPSNVAVMAGLYRDFDGYFVSVPAVADPVGPEFKNTSSSRQTTPKDIYIWKDTPM
ncbi:TPA: KxYKxGKxW signal peptide domain-containing protein [Streptococcus suis]